MARKPKTAEPRIVEFFRTFLRHTKGREWAGRRFELLDWEREWMIPLFGTLRPDGSRQYRMCYLSVARKMGKSADASGIGLYGLTADGEPGAEIYSAAADKDQARIVFKVAREMVEASEELSKICKVYRDAIEVPSTNSVYRVLSSDVPTKHGLNAHMVIFDELHTQPNRDLWDVLLTSTAARQQPLVLAMTTAGWNRQSICYEQYQYACKVRDGIIKDDSFLPVIYETDPKDDWKNIETWRKANPSLGITVGSDYLQRECDRAAETPSYENTFRREHLNQWTEQDVRWLTMEAWNACDGEVNPAELIGRPCWGGLDLAVTTDITALVLCFPNDDGSFIFLPHFWIPEAHAEKRERRDRVPYLTWAKQGFVTLTPGDVTDYGFIRAKVNELGKQFRIVDIGFDPYNATHLAQEIEADGIKMIEFRQGFISMNMPTKAFERAVVSHKLAHGNNPVLRWMASNVVVDTDPAGNLKPNKEKSTEKIDGIVAAIMSLGRAMLQTGTGDSVYEERGLVVL